jgi:5-methylcytosine-specific restriction endonuclease McrA
MDAVLAVVLAVEESGESGSGGSVVFWLIGTLWGVSFLRRRRHLGRISALLLCLLIWPLLAVWALGRVLFRRRGAKGRVEREERERYSRLSAEVDVDSFKRFVSEKSEEEYLERHAENHREYRKLRKWFKAERQHSEATSDALNRAPEKQPPIPRGAYRKKTIPKGLRYDVLARDNFTCQRCLRDRDQLRQEGLHLEVDHLRPESKGGKTVLSNLEAKCSECNSGKGNRYSE